MHFTGLKSPRSQRNRILSLDSDVFFKGVGNLLHASSVSVECGDLFLFLIQHYDIGYRVIPLTGNLNYVNSLEDSWKYSQALKEDPWIEFRWDLGQVSQLQMRINNLKCAVGSSITDQAHINLILLDYGRNLSMMFATYSTHQNLGHLLGASNTILECRSIKKLQNKAFQEGTGNEDLLRDVEFSIKTINLGCPHYVVRTSDLLERCDELCWLLPHELKNLVVQYVPWIMQVLP